MNNATQASTRPRWTLPIIAIVAVIVFVALTLWGGAPRQQASLFAAGVALLIGVLLMYGLAVWYLLIRLLPVQLTIPQTALFSVPQRRLMAVLLLIGAACLVVGGFWDEVWHRSFGFPFGPDLLWRPHLLIYTSLLIPSILALVIVFRMIVNGEGAWQQRFRADRVLGFLTLTGALLVFIVPADPIWHTIYGADISAWSLPHIVLLFTVSVITLLAAAVELTTLPWRQWEAIWRIAAPDVLVLLACAFALELQAQVLATDWENANAIVRARPDWLLPAIYVALAAFMGSLSNHALRRWGAATAIGLLMLAIRFGLIQLFSYQRITINSWLPILPPLIALDVWYAFRIKTGKAASSATLNALATTLGLLLGSIVVINRVFAHPQIGTGNLLSVSVACVLIGTGASWIGQTLGHYLATENKHLEEVGRTAAWMRPVPVLLLAGTLIFIVCFIVTATPPR